MNNLKKIAAAAILAAAPFAAMAATPAPAADNMAPNALLKVEQAGQVSIEKSFKTEIPGMTGYLIKQTSGQYAVVMGKDGYLYVGGIIGPDGKNIIQKYMAKYVPAKDYSKFKAQLDKIGHLVTWGKDGAPVAYVFADPNCIFCHKFYEMAEPLVKAGKLQVKWVIVDFLKASSQGRAAAILQAKDPTSALVSNENGFIAATEEGGIVPTTATPAIQGVLKQHMKIMRDAGFNGTPAMLYKADGKWIGTMMQSDTLGKIVNGEK